MNSKEFRAELEKIMPGYSWTVRRRHAWLLKLDAESGRSLLLATGIRSSGSNRLSTLEVTRIEQNGSIEYLVRSSGYGTRAPWLHENTDGTLARALRGLQDFYKQTADKYRQHEADIEAGRGKRSADHNPK